MNRGERQAMTVVVVFLLLLLAFGVLVFIYGENRYSLQHGLTSPALTKYSDSFFTGG